MKKLGLFLLVCLLAAPWASASDGRVLLYGYVVEGDYASALDEKPSKEEPVSLDGVRLEIHVDGQVMQTITNRNSGFYSIVLPIGVDYQIRFSKSGYLPKTFDIRASEIPEQEWEEAFKLFTDVSLFPETESATADLVGNLVSARCHFDPKRERLSWDLVHAVESFERFMTLADPDRMALKLGQ